MRTIELPLLILWSYLCYDRFTWIFQELKTPDELYYVQNEQEVVRAQLQVYISLNFQRRIVTDIRYVLEKTEYYESSSQENEHKG